MEAAVIYDRAKTADSLQLHSKHMGRWEVLLFCALAAVFKVAYLKWVKKLGITVWFKFTALLVITYHCCWVIAATLIMETGNCILF